MDKEIVEVESYRNSLVAYVYRLIGSVEEAEDITQECMIKYISHIQTIETPKAWLFKVATNLAWDFLKSARYRHENYKGIWLPEPYIDEACEFDESLSMALLVVMEKLSLKERVVFILHDIFDFPHNEVSMILETSIQNSRQLLSRAKRKLGKKQSKYLPSKEEHDALTHAFLSAVKQGDLAQLQKLFSEELIFLSDGGGKAKSAQKVIRGKRAVIRFLLKITSRNFLQNKNELSTQVSWYNGSLGFLILYKNEVITSFHIKVKKGKIVGIYVLRNPDKLQVFNKDKK